MVTRKKVTVDSGEATKPRRVRVSVEGEYPSSGQASTYFTNIEERSDLKFVSSGCPTMNAALGGGWAIGRVVNIVGDKSSGKTLLAIEATANFHREYPRGYTRYKEAEAAFDEKYAAALGMPVEAIDFKGQVVAPEDVEKLAELTLDLKAAEGSKRDTIERAIKRLEKKGVGKAGNTVEAFYEDLLWCMDQHPNEPILYVLDSLDALSDEAEQKRDIDDGSYGGSKPKKMGELFRRLVDRMAAQDVLLIVISQLRDKMNAMTFGEKQTRSGGRALDFYASQIVWLAEVGKIKKTISGVERVIGVDVRARMKKNKVGLPFRECSYPLLFGYGIDDLSACVEWLVEVKREVRLEEVGLSKSGYKISLPKLRDRGGDEVREMRAKLNAIVWEEWQRIETSFMPKSRKY